MPLLKDRLEEIMRAMRWEHADLVRVSGASSSVVSQWLGKGSKEIKSIGKMTTAMRIEAASGYSALWLAEGEGAKLTGKPPQYGAAPSVMEPHQELRNLLDRMGQLLAAVPPDQRRAVGDTLKGWAEEGGALHYRGMLVALLAGEAP